MPGRLHLWAAIRDHLRTSWWFGPGACVAFAVGLSVLVERVDDGVRQDASAWYLFRGGAGAAREVLSTIASSMMTFTGVVFSVTVLVLQLASTQFSPRVLRTFLKDRRTQVVLGVFVGTFVFALLGLRKARGTGEAIEEYVPSFTVWSSIVLALGSVVAFIGFIHHIAQSIRATVVIRRVAEETRASIEKLYPERVRDVREDGGVRDVREGGDVRDVREDGDESLPAFEYPSTYTVTNCGRAGVLAFVDADALEAAAVSAGVAVRVVPLPGDFVPHGGVLAEIGGDTEALDGAVVQAAVHLKHERDVSEDALFGLRELVDIAERALSPSLNDPSTAVEVLDQVHDLLRLLSGRRFPPPLRTTERHGVVLILPRHDFDAAVRLSLDEIRQYAGGSIQVLRRLRELVVDLLEVAPAHRRTELRAQLSLLGAAAARTVPDVRDRDLAMQGYSF